MKDVVGIVDKGVDVVCILLFLLRESPLYLYIKGVLLFISQTWRAISVSLKRHISDGTEP